MANVHIFGNSYAYGLYGREADWSSLLKLDAGDRRVRNEQPYVSVINHSGPGNMLVHSLESEQIQANVNCNRRGRQLAIFCIGSAEACIVTPKGDTEPRRSLPDFQQDLSRLADVIADLNEGHDESPLTPMYASSTPVDEAVAREIWKGDIFNNDRFIEYDEVVKTHASDMGADFIDLRTGFDATTMLTFDGVHANQLGNRFMLEKIGGAALGCLGFKDLSSISAQMPELAPRDQEI